MNLLKSYDDTSLRRLIQLVGASGGGLTEYDVTGNPASFNTNVAKPLKQLLVPFAPIQAGTGDPSPENIRPITGWTGCNVTQTGKNLFDLSAFEFDDTNYSHGYPTATVPASRTVVDTLAKLIGTTVCYSATTTGSTGTSAQPIGAFRLSSNGTLVFQFNPGQTKEIPSFDPSTVTHIFIYGSSNGNKASVSDMMFEVGSTESDHTPYSGTTIPIAFPALGKNLINAQDKTLTKGGYLYNDAISLEAGTYTISFDSTGSSSATVAMYDADGNVLTSGSHNIPWTFTLSSDAASCKIYVGGAGEYTNIQIEKGSSKTSYEPYTTTAYGGTLDVTTGVLTVEWAYLTFDGSTGVSGTAGEYNGNIGTDKYFTIPLSKYTSTQVSSDNALMDIAKPAPNSIWTRPDEFVWNFAINNSVQLHVVFDNVTVGIATSDDNTTRRNKIKAWLAENPIHFCYELAEPIEYQLTPQQVTALVGDNVLFTDTNGENEITYLKKG